LGNPRGRFGMRQELEPAIALARMLPADALPSLLGELEEIRVTALARLAVPASVSAPDELLEVPEAAARLSVSPNYLYRHARRYPFTRREGRKLLFSAKGIEQYIGRKPR
jgi:hypothetical protein